ncbi:acetate--CoA ligase family protein [Alcaligenaceae bacterium]|nr:acetate--CoA ligase family protein [Alcaligenaceae bacterium]
MNSASPLPLSDVFAPRSVAIIGASDDPERLSGRPLRYLLQAGFTGRIMPVNPNRQQVQGVPAYPSIEALPELPDLALLVVPAARIKEMVLACVRCGIRGIYLLSGGFAEIGPEGEGQQRELHDIVRAAGVRVLGPNCLGAFNTEARFFGTFATSLERGLPRTGPVAIVSQSGAYGQHLAYLAAQRRIGVSYLITTGNELDIELSECLGWLVEQPGVRVIMAYAEGIRNGPGLIRSLEAARLAGKAVVFLKVGQSEAGARAASSHTAALTGSDRVFDAIARQYGVYRAHSTEEQLDVAQACARGVWPRGNRLAIVSLSGGAGAHAADLADQQGLDVAPLPQILAKQLAEIIPFGNSGNPVDVTGQAVNDLEMFSAALRHVAESGAYDAVFVFLTTVPLARALAAPLRRAILTATENVRSGRPIVLSMAADPDVIRDYEADGFFVFEDLARGVKVLGALAHFGRSFNRPPVEHPSPAPVGTAISGQGSLSEATAKKMFAAAGITVLSEALAHTAGDAVAAASRLGFPVAMKIVSADILHKTEIGGVLLGVDDAPAVAAGFDLIMQRARRAFPGARIDGVLVSPMAPDGLDVIVGTTRDPVFGPLVMFGLGGVAAECFEDVAFRAAPVSGAVAREMIAETRAARLLAGWRGAPACDVDEVARVIVALSEMAARPGGRIQTMEINPLRVLPQGRGAIALDALAVFDSEAEARHGADQLLGEQA